MWNALVDHFLLRGGAGLCVAGLCIGWWALKRKPPRLRAVVESFLSGQGVIVGLSLLRAGLVFGSLGSGAVDELRTYLTLAGIVVECVSVKSIVALCTRRVGKAR